jgi:hypothetical protein
MSSTGLIDFNANYINSDIIDVNQKLTVNNIDIIDLINDNFNDLSGKNNHLPTICLLTTKACGCGITLTGKFFIVINIYICKIYSWYNCFILKHF